MILMSYIQINEIEFLRQHLPICVDILSTYENMAYCSSIISNKNVALLNYYGEWLIYSTDIDWICSTIQSLSQNGLYRFLLYTPYNNVIKKFKHYHQNKEYFMIQQVAQTNNFSAGRQANIEDLDTIVDMQKKYVDEEIDWPYYRCNMRDTYIQRIREGLVFVDPQGFSKVEITSQYSNIIKLGRIYTIPQKRGMGYAQKLLSYVNNWCEDKGYIPCLNVNCKNDIAIHLYNNCGYTNIGQVIYMRRS